MIDSIKIETLVPLPPLIKFATPFFTENIIKQLDPAMERLQQPQSGFACFIYGYFFEKGFDREPNYQKAYNHYLQGALHFLDPLCAYRLAEIFSSNKSTQFLQQPSQVKAYAFYLMSVLCEFHYNDFKVQFISIDEATSKDLFLKSFISELDSSSNLAIYGELVFDQAAYLLSKQPSYPKLIEAFFRPYPQMSVFIWQIFLVLIFPDRTDNKQVETIVNILTDSCTACLSQLGTHKEHSNLEQQLPIVFQQLMTTLTFIAGERQRELLFELTFFVKNIIQIKKRNNLSEESPGQFSIWEPLSKCYEQCQQDFNKLIHQALVLRTLAKIEMKGLGGRGSGNLNNAKRLLLKDMELPRDPNSNSQALSYFKMAKLCLRDNDNLNYKIHIQKAKALFETRLQATNQNRYERIVCSFYLARIANLEGHVQSEMEYLEQTQLEPILLQRVRTLQFHIIMKKASCARMKVAEQQLQKSDGIQIGYKEEVIVSSQQQVKQEEVIVSHNSQLLQEVSAKESNASEAEDQQSLLQSYRQKLQTIRSVQLERKHLSFNQIDNKEFVQPKVVNIFSKTQSANFVTKIFVEKQDNLVYVEKELTERVFVSRGKTKSFIYFLGAFNSLFYKVFLLEKRFSLKIVTDKKQFDKEYLVNMRKIDHPNLRKILGIKMEKEKFLEIVYDYFEYNLYSFARNSEFSFEDRKKLALDIISGLTYLHSKQIKLGNLKPSNILIKDGRAVISDWELPIRQNIGGYTAPDEKLEYGSDIYSLGWILVLLFLQVDVGCGHQFDGICGMSQIPGLQNQDLSKVDIKSVTFQYSPRYQQTEKGKLFMETVQKMIHLQFSKRLPLSDLQKSLQDI